MKTKSTLISTGLLTLSYLSGTSCCAQDSNKPEDLTSQKRPNIVYIMTDDEVYRSLGCYGGKEFKTPNLDKLAKNGAQFDNCFYATTVCMPSRATIMMGQYLSKHKCGFDTPTNKNITREEFKLSYPALLKKSGYYMGFIGKLGFPVAEKKDGVRPTKLPRGEKEYFDYFYPYGYNDVPPGYYYLKTNKWGLAKSYKNNPHPYITDVTTDLVLDFLDKTTKEQPFYLSLHLWEPKGDYHPLKTKPEYLKIFEDTEFEILPDYVEGANTKLPEFIRKNWRGVGLHKHKTNTKAKYQKWMRQQAAVLYGVDLAVGKLVKKLEEKNMLDNTIIMFTSDNGFMAGSHGMTGKAVLYEETVRQPLIMFDGRGNGKGKRIKELASSVDIAPTILDMAGIPAPETMQGKSLKPLIDGAEVEWRDMVYMENHFSCFRSKALESIKNNPAEVKKTKANSVRCRGVRSHKWKYFTFFEHDPAYEVLFDLENDPYELKNLASSPEHAEILKKLRIRCNEELKKAKFGTKAKKKE